MHESGDSKHILVLKILKLVLFIVDCTWFSPHQGIWWRLVHASS